MSQRPMQKLQLVLDSKRRSASHSGILKIVSDRKSLKLMPKPFCNEVSKMKKPGGQLLLTRYNRVYSWRGRCRPRSIIIIFEPRTPLMVGNHVEITDEQTVSEPIQPVFAEVQDILATLPHGLNPSAELGFFDSSTNTFYAVSSHEEFLQLIAILNSEPPADIINMDAIPPEK